MRLTIPSPSLAIPQQRCNALEVGGAVVRIQRLSKIADDVELFVGQGERHWRVPRGALR